MRPVLMTALRTLGYRSLWLAGKLDRSYAAGNVRLREARTATWYADPRHVTLRVDYPLDGTSRVLDVGGFEGDWAVEIFARYGCRVDVFEPIPQFADALRRRLDFTDRILVHEFGLGGSTRHVDMSAAGDRSSHIHVGEGEVTAEIRDVVDHLAAAGLDHVDLMKLNIEGAEYELLERVLDAGCAGRFAFILVQFHDETADAPARVKAITTRLKETHELMWRFPFVWESWRRR